MSLTGEQKPKGTKAAPQKNRQQGSFVVGQPGALAWGGQAEVEVEVEVVVVGVVGVGVGVGVVVVIGVVVVVRQEQALEMRELPHVATGLGAWTVLERRRVSEPGSLGDTRGMSFARKMRNLRRGEELAAEGRVRLALIGDDGAEAVVAVAPRRQRVGRQGCQGHESGGEEMHDGQWIEWASGQLRSSVE